MPAYHRSEGLARVGAGLAWQPVLSAQQIEDVVAFLMTFEGLTWTDAVRAATS